MIHFEVVTESCGGRAKRVASEDSFAASDGHRRPPFCCEAEIGFDRQGISHAANPSIAKLSPILRTTVSAKNP